MTDPIAAQGREAIVLLVEDNEDHAFLTRESFTEAKLQVDLHHVDNGEKCMAFLRRLPPYENAPRPDILLLDIHMPRMDGYEVMEAISKDESLHSLPVIVLTTSADIIDVDRMYGLRCSSFIKKPVDFDGFTKAMRDIAGYWFSLVVLPEPPKR
jgi:two-component system, chemotaxis family, response regulator Rcp1